MNSFCSFLVVVTVEFTSSEYSGCNIRDEAIIVTIKATRNASLPFVINVTITQLETSTPATISTDPISVTFNPGETRKSASLRFLPPSSTRGGAIQKYELELHLLDSNNLTISINNQQTVLAIVQC